MFLLLAFLRMGQAQEDALKFFLVEGPNGKPLGKIRNMTQDPSGYMMERSITHVTLTIGMPSICY